MMRPEKLDPVEVFAKHVWFSIWLQFSCEIIELLCYFTMGLAELKVFTFHNKNPAAGSIPCEHIDVAIVSIKRLAQNFGERNFRMGFPTQPLHFLLHFRVKAQPLAAANVSSILAHGWPKMTI